MGSFMDFNEDGKVDSGEQFIGYQIYNDMTKGSGGQRPKAAPKGKIGWFEIIMIGLIAFEVLKAIAGLIYH